MASPRNDFPTEVFVARSEMPVSAAALFRWHCRPEAFTDLLPPGDPTTVERPAEIRNGEEMVLRVGVGPFRLRWVARIYDVVPERQFRDLQISGPFRFWLHSHLMEPIDDRRSTLEDRVTFALRGGRLAHFLGAWFVRRKLQSSFAATPSGANQLARSQP